MLTAYYICSFLAYSFITCVWSNKDIPNLIIKMFFFIMTFLTLVLGSAQLGLIALK